MSATYSAAILCSQAQATASSRLADLEKEREEIAKQRDALLKQAEVLDQELSTIQREHGRLHNTAISAAGKIPDELLSHIFIYAVEGSRNAPDAFPRVFSSTTGKQPRVPLTEVRISHVCSRWRDVVLGEEHLWAFFSNIGRPRTEDHAERLSVYANRSGDLPLELWIDIDWKEPSYPQRPSPLDPLLDVAISYGQYWGCVSIHAFISEAAQGTILDRLIEESAPDLKYLDLVFYPANKSQFYNTMPAVDGAMEGVEGTIFPRNCDSLTHLKLGGPIIGCVPHMENVTSLYLDGTFNSERTSNVTFEMFRDLITTLPLQSLTVIDNFIKIADAPPILPVEGIEMEHLKHLRWGNPVRGYSTPGLTIALTCFLAALRAPSLETLTFLGIEPISPNTVVNLFAGQSMFWCPKVHTFAILNNRDFPQDGDWLPFVARGTPNLKTLIVYGHGAEPVMEHLAEKNHGRQPLWSHLESLIDIGIDTPVANYVSFLLAQKRAEHGGNFCLKIPKDRLDEWNRTSTTDIHEELKGICRIDYWVAGRDFPVLGPWEIEDDEVFIRPSLRARDTRFLIHEPLL
ncbi:hypothetical protein CC1G_09193 [Coprinopsis cinerea okayama7|uniref:Uncharacterized protein n=1 Tax=Coprinopsis cinerea (strain Okayama-7 / 130 / ATCC MYA-4618 / FGSC 9003) TaxID=240176 RepID=A8P9X0_COPC7|nr:hypothetical protein CC1G_09193 [Coprinopsis cinerea okayama7\|eukprot:XP_001839859.1 hypothetical protein CC1G_09193 [Coprinopsis cinerea okayama7\